MSEVAAIDGANPIEADVFEELALLDDKGTFSTSRDKVEEEGNPHAVSTTIVAREQAANEADAVQDDQARTASTSRERQSLIDGSRRYKNPILAIFAVMSVARKTMQDVAKSSKEETRIMKKHWERISHEVSDHYNTAATESDRIQNWSGTVMGILSIAPMALPGFIPAHQDTYEGWAKCADWLGHKISDTFTISSYVLGAVPNKEKLVEGVNWVAKTGQTASGPLFQQWGQSTQFANQRDVAVGQQQSDASRTDYQSRQDEKRNEDEAVKSIDQMTQRLMEQEVRAFEVRG